MTRGRLYVEWFGFPIVELDVELRRDEDGGTHIDTARRGDEPVGEPLPVQTGVSGLADTALAEHSDPETRASGFGLPLAPRHDDDRRTR